MSALSRMRDADVRLLLHERLVSKHSRDLDSTFVVDEFGICGEVRVDVAVINGYLTGFELKSASDTLARLPRQVEMYSKVLDFSNLVVAECHFEKSLEMLPKWWGYQVVGYRNGELEIVLQKQPSMSPILDPYLMAQVLWKSEALEILEKSGSAKGMKSKTRQMIWQVLADTMSLNELRSVIRSTLKYRAGWRQKLITSNVL